ncbi:hypothetical protein B0F90DRAFT_1696998 [Multifurca ochricompacta]|uniref:Flavin-containing monooxygenase n=1 Tax=Multifurca ochricompacta TaxID=376703 RepID=A0AAD4M9U3_9AGAM|nr:hypothetical protein B0F90DRAFT_1696998 [Multifurca ochricompacta]
MFKTLIIDLPKEVTRNWEIVLFEQRDNIVATPHFPFPVGTPLFPNHTFEVLSADWRGNDVFGYWQVATLDHRNNCTNQARFDHLVVARGHNHYPVSGPGREVLHSVFYREPEVYSRRNVLVVGGGASGRDIVQQVVGFANSTYASVKYDHPSRPIPFPHIPGVERVPALARFTPVAPVFEDGTPLPHVNTVFLATGYELRFPFLSSSIHNTSIITPLPDPSTCDMLTNNGRYLRPLFRHIFPLAPTHAPHALAFVGPPPIPLLIAHALKDEDLLPPKAELLADLRVQEAEPEDPARVGHRIPQPGGGTAYQNALVRLLQERGLGRRPGFQPLGTPFTETWRVFAEKEMTRLRRAWVKVESLGEEEVERWLGRVKKGDEREWYELMVQLDEWFNE